MNHGGNVMKLSDDFVMIELGEDNVLVPVGEMANTFRGILRLNETAAFIVNCLKQEATMEQIVSALCAEYKVEPLNVEKDVNKTLDTLRERGAILE